MAPSPLLAQAQGVAYSLGGAPLFAGVDFALRRGERAALVGQNGAGKSTLMRMLSGTVEPDAGVISFAQGALAAFVPQDPDMAGFATLRAYAQGASVRGAGTGQTPAHAAEAALASFDLDPDRAPHGLSGGEARRAALARAFAADANILLLDEPTNHLDIDAIEDLEARLRAFPGAALIVSHDRRFLERVTTCVYWLRQGRVLQSKKGYAGFDDWAADIERQDVKTLSKLEKDLQGEEHWLQRGVTARRSRNEGRRRRLEALRQERRARKTLSASPRVALAAERGQESGRIVIDAQGLSKSFGARAVIRTFSVKLMRGDRVGVIGANGAGKTTLLEILLQRAAPDEGSVRHGERLEIVYVDQARALLDPRQTIWDALTPAGGDHVMAQGRSRHVAAYASDFLFPTSMLRQPIGALSGGERNRVALAVALAKPSNLLVLDEPTNDLDIETLDALEEMVAGYDGTALIVSHDRAFLDNVTTQVIGALGDGRWAETPGGYADFVREYPGRSAQPAAPARKPEHQAPATPRVQRKLSYGDERRSQDLERLLPLLEAEIATLERTLSASDLFSRDPDLYARTAQRLAAAREEQDQAETDWLELEEKRARLADL